VVQILSEQDRAATGPHRGIVADEEILDAVGKDVVGTHAPD
jgi:hypothetical protein